MKSFYLLILLIIILLIIYYYSDTESFSFFNKNTHSNNQYNCSQYNFPGGADYNACQKGNCTIMLHQSGVPFCVDKYLFEPL